MVTTSPARSGRLPPDSRLDSPPKAKIVVNVDASVGLREEVRGQAGGLKHFFRFQPEITDEEQPAPIQNNIVLAGHDAEECTKPTFSSPPPGTPSSYGSPALQPVESLAVDGLQRDVLLPHVALVLVEVEVDLRELIETKVLCLVQRAEETVNAKIHARRPRFAWSCLRCRSSTLFVAHCNLKDGQLGGYISPTRIGSVRRSGRQNHWPPDDWLEPSATPPADSQALLRVDASDSALPDLEALSDHCEVHSSVPVTRLSEGCLAHCLAKLVVTIPTRLVPKCTSALAHHAARSTLADVELGLQPSSCVPPRSGPHHFFPFTALSIWMSSACSATICFSRRFSSSSPFNRLASPTLIPAYFFFHA